MKKCEKCKIMFEGNYCPMCGALGVDEKSDAPVFPAEPAPKKKIPTLAIVGAACFVFILIMAFATKSPENDTTVAQEVPSMEFSSIGASNEPSVAPTSSAPVSYVSAREQHPVVASVSPSVEASVETSVATTVASVAPSVAPSVTPSVAPSVTPSVAPASSVTTSQQNALSKAQQYLAYTAFSHDGLVAQLVYEGFSQADSVYAADNCGADWNAQALVKAKSYLDFTSFSYTGLIDQLEYDKYTTAQATYAADNCGADWNAQAAAKAQQYLDIMAFSRSSLISQLEYDGYTAAQAEYGASAVGL